MTQIYDLCDPNGIHSVELAELTFESLLNNRDIAWYTFLFYDEKVLSLKFDCKKITLGDNDFIERHNLGLDLSDEDKLKDYRFGDPKYGAQNVSERNIRVVTEYCNNKYKDFEGVKTYFGYPLDLLKEDLKKHITDGELTLFHNGKQFSLKTLLTS